MNKKVRWGILGAAKIAINNVIPSMQSGNFSTVSALASRSPEKAAEKARHLGIKKHYDSYKDLLADEEIDAVYNPLPNHLHLKWTRKAAEAGKHVLCEKPVGMNADEVRELIEIRNRTGVKIQEAFMVRTHPTWLAVRELIKNDKIGEIRAITGFFSYFNDDKTNIRNKLEMGGGGLLDIGCYCINISRWIFEDEPKRVSGLIERDTDTGIDSLTSAILDFPKGQATFTCSTRLVPYQRMHFFGTKGRIEVQIPFNIPLETPTKIFIDDGSDLSGKNIKTLEFDEANKFTIQGDLFSKAILDDTEQILPLEDSFGNMAVIDAVFRSAETSNWEMPESL